MSDSTIEFVYDVTERVKEILVTTNDGKKEHPLIAYNRKHNKEESYKRIVLDFRRGMVRTIDGKIFDKHIFPVKLSGDEEDDKKNKDLKNAEFQMVETHFSKFEKIFGKRIVDGKSVYKSENFSNYEPQSFLSIATNEIFYRLLGSDFEFYIPSFSNGKVCHFWKETIVEEDHLCMLVVDDGFKIDCDRPSENPYCLDLPGAMMIEIKVPISVIEEAKSITEQHITRALVSSTELFNLLQVNPKIISLRDCDENLKVEVKKSLELVLTENGSRQPLPNLGRQIREPNFKDTLPQAVNKEVILSEQQLENLRDSLNSVLVQNEKPSPKVEDESRLAISPLQLSEEKKPKSDKGLGSKFLFLNSEGSQQGNIEPNKAVRRGSNYGFGDKTSALEDAEAQAPIRRRGLSFSKSS